MYNRCGLGCVKTPQTKKESIIMKKFIAQLMAVMMVLALGAGGNEKAGDDINA